MNDRLKSRINVKELLARTENDRELLNELFSIFVEEFPYKLHSLRDAFSRGDWPQVALVSHAIKGMLSNLSVTNAASSAARLEQAARAGEHDQAREAFAHFQHETEGLLRELQAHIQEARHLENPDC